MCDGWPDCGDASDEEGCAPCMDEMDDVIDDRMPAAKCEEGHYVVMDLKPVSCPYKQHTLR